MPCWYLSSTNWVQFEEIFGVEKVIVSICMTGQTHIGIVIDIENIRSNKKWV